MKKEFKRLYESDYRLMCLIWENEPTSSMNLVSSFGGTLSESEADELKELIDRHKQ